MIRKSDECLLAGVALDWHVAGNDYIDLTCGYSAANFGQSFPLDRSCQSAVADSEPISLANRM
ncbi:MAG: hypothetical protein R3C56_41580 [Pirellulaceae bacterium]